MADRGRDRRQNAPPSRVPPHNLSAEESLLGALLLSRDAISAVAELHIGASDFYKPAHQHVYEAIRVLAAVGEPVDAVTVAEELRRANLLDAIGGAGLLLDLQAATPAISNAARYARIVQDTALLRRLIGVAGEIAELGYDEPDDVTKALDVAESKVFELADRRVIDSTKAIGDLLSLAISDLEQAYERGTALTGIATGYTDLDELLNGLQPSTLNVVGARPSMGKCVAWDTELLDPATGELVTAAELHRRGTGGRVGAGRLPRPARRPPRGRHARRPSSTTGSSPSTGSRTRLGRIGAHDAQPSVPHRGRAGGRWRSSPRATASPCRAACRGSAPSGSAQRRGGRSWPTCWATAACAAPCVARTRRASIRSVPVARPRRDGGAAPPRPLAPRRRTSCASRPRVFRLDTPQLAALPRAPRRREPRRPPRPPRPRTRSRPAPSASSARCSTCSCASASLTELRAESIRVAGERQSSTCSPSCRSAPRRRRELELVAAELAMAAGDRHRPGRHGSRRSPVVPDTDVCWDEIVAIDHEGDEQVYDLTVPGHHNFVAADVDRAQHRLRPRHRRATWPSSRPCRCCSSRWRWATRSSPSASCRRRPGSTRRRCAPGG